MCHHGPWSLGWCPQRSEVRRTTKPMGWYVHPQDRSAQTTKVGGCPNEYPRYKRPVQIATPAKLRNYRWSSSSSSSLPSNRRWELFVQSRESCRDVWTRDNRIPLGPWPLLVVSRLLVGWVVFGLGCVLDEATPNHATSRGYRTRRSEVLLPRSFSLGGLLTCMHGCMGNGTCAQTLAQMLRKRKKKTKLLFIEHDTYNLIHISYDVELKIMCDTSWSRTGERDLAGI